MTENEAKYYLLEHKPIVGFKTYNEALDVAVKALEKQMPKKPNKAIDSTWGVKKEVSVCPVCDYYLSEVYFIPSDEKTKNEKVTFCETCGQKIDWEDGE